METGSTLGLVRHKLSTARSVTVLTGAGISADSGVPTFRGADGLWRHYRAEDLATPEAFARDPRLVWEWYNWRRELIATKRPNPAHEAVASMEQRFKQFWLITQNVDGLHGDAGSRQLSEIHGNLWKVRCTRCRDIVENRDVPIAMLPLCRSCGGLLRPHIVWFGESLAEEDLDRSAAALQSSDVCLIVGTSGMVYPAAGFGAIAKQAGAFIVEINLDATAHSNLADATLQGRARDVVPLLLEA
ncbi:MAG TPA: NAD-dependent deacylase [Nitrospira sp.]|nr:NAD-dependent deacylase [Nitrospira sp.]